MNGITECPIPPGASKTYTFLLTQYGTSWYHSHFAEQLGNGVIGPIQINGPASANYDIDLGTFPIHDWYYKGADDLFATINDPTNLAAGAPPPSDNIFFNGTNINPAGPGGAYARVVLEPGKSHRLRLLNPSVENHFSVSIVGHSMTVIATDLVPVAPTVVTSVFLAIGQRYDVIVDASAAPGHYWINATLSGTGLCGASNNKFPAAIMSYSNAPLPNALPTNPGTAPPDSLCQDRTDWQPVVTRTVPSHMPQPDEAVSISFLNSQAASTVAWLVNDSAIDVIWEKPTLEFVLQNDTSGLPAHENVVPIPDSSAVGSIPKPFSCLVAMTEPTDRTAQWTYFVINNAFGVPHPAHLHGHDFMILGHSAASANPFAGVPTPFDAATDSGALDFTNPTRRDVTMIPGNGWLVIGFRNDNPGAWLLHCHIAWHVAQGLAVQFLERADQIVSTTGLAASSLEPNCDAWRTYEPTDPFHKSGSGLRL